MSTATAPDATADFGGYLREKLFDRGPRTVRTDAVSLAMSAAVLVAVGFAGVMIAVARGGEGVALWTAPAAAAAYWLTERTHRFGYTPLAANLLVVPLLFNALGELFSGDVGARLAAGSDLLTVLTWVMMFQWKEPRHYLWLCALAVLQAAVGSVLTTDFTFGVLIPVLLFLTVRAVMHFVAVQSTRGDGVRRGPAVRRREPEGDIAATLVRPSVIATDPGLSSSDFPRHERAFGRAALIVSGGAAITSLLLFALTPRWWVDRVMIEERAVAQLGAGEAERTSQTAVTGVGNSVTLGSMSEVLVSDAAAFDVEIFDHEGEKVSVEEYAARLGDAEPLFRGGILNRYDGGRWTLTRASEDSVAVQRFRPTPPPFAERSFVRQQIRVRSPSATKLFAIDPVVFLRLDDPEEGLRYEYRTLGRTIEFGFSGRSADRLSEWTAYSPVTAELADRFRRRESAGVDQLTGMLDRLQCLTLPREGLERLIEKAKSLTADLGDDADAGTIARTLVRHLTASGRYTYSVEAHTVEEGVDPIEAFLFERRQGHCEYFASALALMLRANAVPARLVTGYKGGSENSLNGVFKVEQRHAHAWVEALVDGVWRTYDPTPAAVRAQSVETQGSRWGFLADAVAVASDLWQQYVVLLNIKTQQAAFFKPIADAIAEYREAAEALRESEEGASALSFFAALGRPTAWFAWKGGVIGYALLLLIGGALATVFGFRRRGGDDVRRGGRAGVIEVAFFERYRGLCRAAGLKRPDPATDREFSAVVGTALAADAPTAAVDRVVEAFYEARFGGRAIAAERLAGLESDLEAVDEGLRHRVAAPG